MDEMKRVEQIQDIQSKFTKLSQELYDLIKDDESSMLKKFCLEWLRNQSAFNSEYSIGLLKLIPMIYHKEKFKKIIKPLEDEIRGQE